MKRYLVATLILCLFCMGAAKAQLIRNERTLGFKPFVEPNDPFGIGRRQAWPTALAFDKNDVYIMGMWNDARSVFRLPRHLGGFHSATSNSVVKIRGMDTVKTIALRTVVDNIALVDSFVLLPSFVSQPSPYFFQKDPNLSENNCVVLSNKLDSLYTHRTRLQVSSMKAIIPMANGRLLCFGSGYQDGATPNYYTKSFNYLNNGYFVSPDSSKFLNLRNDRLGFILYGERVGHNKIELTQIVGSQVFLCTSDSMGVISSGRLLFTNPSLRFLYDSKLMANPFGGYTLVVRNDSALDLSFSYIIRLNDQFQVQWRRYYRGITTRVATDGSVIVVSDPTIVTTFPQTSDTNRVLNVKRLDHLGNLVFNANYYGANKMLGRRKITRLDLRSDSSLFLAGEAVELFDSTRASSIGRDLYWASIPNMGKPYQPYIPGVGPNSVADALPPVPIAVFPNPAHDVAYLQGLTDKPEPFILLNQLGQAVRTGTVSNSQNSINLQGLPTGLYVLALRDKRLRLVVE